MDEIREILMGQSKQNSERLRVSEKSLREQDRDWNNALLNKACPVIRLISIKKRGVTFRPFRFLAVIRKNLEKYAEFEARRN